MPDGPLNPMPDGVRVAIRLAPRAKADRIVAVAMAGDGAHVLKASVRAPAHRGQANDALLRLLAETWQLPRRDLAIVVGVASRQKTVHIAGDPRLLLPRLSSLIATLPVL